MTRHEFGLASLLLLSFCLRARLGFCITSLVMAVAFSWRYRQSINRVNLLCLLLLVLAFAAPILASFDPAAKVLSPDVLGADELGRDQLSRLLYANRNSLFIAFFGSLCATLVSITIAVLLAIAPKPLRIGLKWLVQVWLTIPVLIVFMLGLVLLGSSGPATLIGLFTLALWPEPARILEERIQHLDRAEFVISARMAGAGKLRIFYREMLPNLKEVGAAAFLMTFISAVLLESTMGFLGMGLAVGTPSLGHLIEYGTRKMDQQPTILLLSLGILLAWIYCLRNLLSRLGKPNPSLVLA